MNALKPHKHSPLLRIKASALLLTNVLTFGCIGGVQAALIDIGNGLIRDTDQNLIWTQDLSLARTEKFGVAGITQTGSMSWNVAWNWIAAMNTANYKGYHDWRLTTVTDTGNPGCDFSYSGTDCGYNIDTRTGEIAYLWSVSLGNMSALDTKGQVRPTWGFQNPGPFINIFPATTWTGTAYAGNINQPSAWTFQTHTGIQYRYDQDNQYQLWVVRDDDASVISEPATNLLLGLGAAVGLAVKRSRSLSHNAVRCANSS